MKDWTRKIIGLSLVALFAGYYGGTTLFYHAHEIDGVKIVHSHPYTGDAQHHAHSAASCRTIQLLSGLTFLTSALSRFSRRVFRQLSARQQEHLVRRQGNDGRITPFSCAALPGRLSFPNRYPNESLRPAFERPLESEGRMRSHTADQDVSLSLHNTTRERKRT